MSIGFRHGFPVLNLPHKQTTTMIPSWLQAEVMGYETPVETEPRVVLDIGANVGAFTDMALLKWPSCTIHAYEPNPEAIRQFRENIPQSARVHLTESAVAANDGVAEFTLGDNIATGSLHDIGRQTGLKIQVPTVAASSLPAADYIKIDTEGSEVDILRNLDLSKCETLVIEWHRPQDHAELRWIARDAGLLLHDSVATAPSLGVLKFTRHVIKDRLFIGLPLYGSTCGHFVQCLLAIRGEPRLNAMVKFRIGDSLVSRSRNEITDDFLGSNCSALLFIDSDIVFSTDHVQRIFNHKEPVVGGCYPKKQRELQWVLNMMPGEVEPRPDGLHKVRYIGSGFIRVQREVFEQMIERYKDSIAYHPDSAPNRTAYDLWAVGVYPGTKRYLSEDWWFCQRWLDLGGDVWADTRIKLKHVGDAVYPMQE